MKRFIVWTNYGSYEGWRADDADTWAEAVALRERQLGNENNEVIITELCPLDVRDGRSA